LTRGERGRRIYLGMRGITAIDKLFASLLAMVFQVGTRLFYSIEVRGKRNFTRSPSTIIVINHRQDQDIPILGPLVHFRRGFWPGKRPWFFTREDYFYPGGLAVYFKLRGLLGRLAFALNIGPALMALRAHPMHQLADTKVNQMLWELQHAWGNPKLEQLVRPEALERLASWLGQPKEALGSRSIRDLFSWRYRKLLERKWDCGLIREDMCRRVAEVQRALARKQIETFASLLRQGETLFLAPEGNTSLDGSMLPFKSILYRVVRQSGTAVRFLPIHIVYDSMTTGRTKVFVTFGPEVPADNLPRKKMIENVRQSLARAGVITMSQLGSLFIMEAVQRGQETIHPGWPAGMAPQESRGAIPERGKPGPQAPRPSRPGKTPGCLPGFLHDKGTSLSPRPKKLQDKPPGYPGPGAKGLPGEPGQLLLQGVPEPPALPLPRLRQTGRWGT
jgi:1-acyl-sn-glycerol-3-phosphate acyltransferase